MLLKPDSTLYRSSGTFSCLIFRPMFCTPEHRRCTAGFYEGRYVEIRLDPEEWLERVRYVQDLGFRGLNLGFRYQGFRPEKIHIQNKWV